jgi:hypothetical protein
MLVENNCPKCQYINLLKFTIIRQIIKVKVRKITLVINDHNIYYLSMYIIIVKIGTQTISKFFYNFQEDKFEIFSN